MKFSRYYMFLIIFKNEVKIFSILDHPNITKYLDSEIIENTYFIYLEYVPGGSLKFIIDKYGPLKENLIKKYLKQILDALEYLHSKKIVHRDIKCANILIDVKGNIKFSDFGCSGQMLDDDYVNELNSIGNSDEFLDSLKGTLPWMAPEVVLQQKYGKRADIWSLGCTLIELSTGVAPWGKLENFYQAMNKIGRSNDIPEIPATISSNFKDFLTKCLQRNPKDRFTVPQLKGHPFINTRN
jgi:serine/threonine protein kinase